MKKNSCYRIFFAVFQYGQALIWGEHSSELRTEKIFFKAFLHHASLEGGRRIALVWRGASGRGKMRGFLTPCTPSTISSMNAAHCGHTFVTFVPLRVSSPTNHEELAPH